MVVQGCQIVVAVDGDRVIDFMSWMERRTLSTFFFEAELRQCTRFTPDLALVLAGPGADKEGYAPVEQV